MSQNIKTFKIVDGLVDADEYVPDTANPGQFLSQPGVLTSNAAFDIQGGIVESVLASSAATGLVKSGPGKATLKAINTYTGDTLIGEGILELSGMGQINSLSPVINNAGFLLNGGSYSFGTITGSGQTTLVAGTLTANSIVQNTLNIGGSGSAAAVPEPGTWMLLIVAAMGFASRFLLGKKK